MVQLGVRSIVIAAISAGLLVLPTPEAQALPAQGALSKGQQKCASSLAKDVQKAASAFGKDHLKCIKNGSKGKLVGETVDECAASDPKGKVASGKAKIGADFTKNCTGGKKGVHNEPGWAPSDDASSVVAVDFIAGLFTDLLGPDLDAATVDPKADPNTVSYVPKETSKCQQTVLKDAAKCFDTKGKEFGACLKFGTKGGKISVGTANDPFEHNQDLDQCMAYDGKGKIAKSCGKIASDIVKKCGAPASIDDAIPGCASFPGTLAECVLAKIECRHCQTQTMSAALGVLCDTCVTDPNQPVIDNLTCQTDGTRYCGADPSITCTKFQDCPREKDENGDDIPGTRRCRTVSDFELYKLADPNDADVVLTLIAPIDGTIFLNCGAPDGSGIAQCTCEFGLLAPFTLAGIGEICLGALPLEDCPTCGGQIDCDGGSSGDLNMVRTHIVGGICGLFDPPEDFSGPGGTRAFSTEPDDYEGPEECAVDCATECGGVGNVFEAACGGFCLAGEEDGLPCIDEINCLGSNAPATQGSCVGPVGGGFSNPHAGECQCACLTNVGTFTGPGTFTCVQGVRSEIEDELPGNEGCGVGTVTSVTITKVPLTTNRAFATMVNMNDFGGPDISRPDRIGNRLSCTALQQGSLSGLSMSGSMVFADSQGLDDLLIPLGFTCR